MNARAACRLKTLDFAEVYRYAPGKADWRAAGLPMEGTATPPLHAADAARRDVPTCSLGATVGDAQTAAAEIGDNYCLVVDDGVVVGRLRRDALDHGGCELVAALTEEGPTTICRRWSNAFATGAWRRSSSPTDRRLIGVLHREDGERFLGQQR